MEKIYKRFLVHMKIQSEAIFRWKESQGFQTCPYDDFKKGV